MRLPPQTDISPSPPQLEMPVPSFTRRSLFDPSWFVSVPICRSRRVSHVSSLCFSSLASLLSPLFSLFSPLASRLSPLASRLSSVGSDLRDRVGVQPLTPHQLQQRHGDQLVSGSACPERQSHAAHGAQSFALLVRKALGALTCSELAAPLRCAPAPRLLLQVDSPHQPARVAVANQPIRLALPQLRYGSGRV